MALDEAHRYVIKILFLYISDTRVKDVINYSSENDNDKNDNDVYGVVYEYLEAKREFNKSKNQNTNI